MHTETTPPSREEQILKELYELKSDLYTKDQSQWTHTAFYRVPNTSYSLKTTMSMYAEYPDYDTRLSVEILDMSAARKEWQKIYQPSLYQLPGLSNLTKKTTREDAQKLFREAEREMLRVAVGFL